MATNERPSRLVMGLGIATVVLFSANLLAMLSQNVWPDLHDALFESKDTLVEEVVAPELIIEESKPEFIYEFRSPQVSVSERIHIVHPATKHMTYKIYSHSSDGHERNRTRYRVRSNSSSLQSATILYRDALDMDMEKLERSLEEAMENATGMLHEAEHQSDHANGMTLHLDGLNELLVLQENNLTELVENLNAQSRNFEVKVREHQSEASSRTLLEKKEELKELLTRAKKEGSRSRVILRERKEN